MRLILLLATFLGGSFADFYLGDYSGEGISGSFRNPTQSSRNGCFLNGNDNEDIDCGSPSVYCDWTITGGQYPFPDYCDAKLPCSNPSSPDGFILRKCAQDPMCLSVMRVATLNRYVPRSVGPTQELILR